MYIFVHSGFLKLVYLQKQKNIQVCIQEIFVEHVFYRRGCKDKDNPNCTCCGGTQQRKQTRRKQTRVVGGECDEAIKTIQVMGGPQADVHRTKQ